MSHRLNQRQAVPSWTLTPGMGLRAQLITRHMRLRELGVASGAARMLPPKGSSQPVSRMPEQAPPRAGAVARPRERRAAGASTNRGPPPDDPDPEEPSALNRTWQAALEELETAAEFEALSELARIRSVWLGRWAA